MYTFADEGITMHPRYRVGGRGIVGGGKRRGKRRAKGGGGGQEEEEEGISFFIVMPGLWHVVIVARVTLEILQP